MAIFVQQISSSVPASQISCFRGMFTVVGLFYFARPHIMSLLELKESRAVWFRSIAGAVAVLCYFWNTTQGSAAEAKALANINPLYVAIFSWLIFKEKLNPRELLGLIILILGALILVWNISQTKSEMIWIVGNLGAVFTGIAYLSLKRASGKFPAHAIVFCFGLCVMIVSALGPGDWSIPQGQDWRWLCLVGITGLSGQIFLTQSHLYLKNAIASSLTLLTSILLIFYDTILTQNLNTGYDLLGNIFILIGMGAMAFLKKKPVSVAGAILQSPQKGL
jgi:drug/metabolite transporter (DMT)-like permease